jgi:hypothetical protein
MKVGLWQISKKVAVVQPKEQPQLARTTEKNWKRQKLGIAGLRI